MKVYILMAFLVTVLVQASQEAALNDETTTGIDFGTALEMFYTSFRRMMPCGCPEMQIPVMAPLTIDKYPINVSNEDYNLQGNLASVEVTGLNSFRILDGDFDKTTNRTSFDYFLPEFQILGKYDIKAKFNMAGFPVNTEGQGLVNIKVKDFRVVGDFVMAASSQNPNGLEITDLNLRIQLGNIINNNWNNLWDIAFNNFVNKVAADVTMTAVQELQVKFNDVYSQRALPPVNDVLKNISMQDAINYLIARSAQFDLIECNKQ